MRALSNLELIGMRNTVKSIMTTTVQVFSRTHVADPGGGVTDTYALTYTLKCLYFANSGAAPESINLQYEQIVTSEDFTFIFPVRSPINHEDRLIADGKTFEVKYLAQATSGLEIVMLVIANEVN